jgi:hypothetical protein
MFVQKLIAAGFPVGSRSKFCIRYEFVKYHSGLFMKGFPCHDFALLGHFSLARDGPLLSPSLRPERPMPSS